MRDAIRLGFSAGALVAVFLLAIGGGVRSARAQGEHWYSAVNPNCGGGGTGCAAEHLFAVYGGAITKVIRCYNGYNADGQVTAAYCDGLTHSGTSWYTAGATLGYCDPDFYPTGTGCSNENEKDRSCGTGNPVNPKAGVKVEVATDFATEGNPPLAFTRTYWSAVHFWGGRAAIQARLGRGWRANFDARLWVDGYGRVYVILPDGRELRFELSGATYTPRGYNPVTRSWAPASNITYSLVQSGSDWELTQPDDSVLTFNAAGEFTSIKYRGGYTQTLTWSNGQNTQVSDNLGRTITFAYGANGRLSESTDPDGRKIKYTYLQRAGFDTVTVPPGVDVSNADTVNYALDKVIYPDGTPGTDADNPTVQYHYEDATFWFALTGITDERGIRYATWAYNGDGRVASSEHAGGVENYTFSYDFANGRTTVTNPLSKETVFHFNRNVPGNSRLTRIEGKASLNCAASDTDFAYDGNGFVNQLTDGEGRITQIGNDSRGLPTSITRGQGTPPAATTTYTWHAAMRVPTQIVEPGLTTTPTWNPNTKRLVQVTQADTTTHSVPYPTNGQTRTWVYTYTTAAGLLASVDGPLAGPGDTVFYTYNANGFIATVTNEVGHVTTFTAWNGRGQPTSMTDPNNVVTMLGYDERGRLTTVTVDPGANQALTTIAYNGPGDITKITRPNGAFLEFSWDNARRLSKIEDNTGAFIEYDRNDLGNITARRIKDAGDTIFLAQTATYDELGRLLTFVGAATQTWTLGYDRTDNLVSVTDPRSNVYSQAFDPLNRLIGETDEDKAVVALTRNGKDEITAYTDPRSLTTSYVRNGFGEAIQRTSPDSGTTIYEYNALGKPTRITDARGIVTDLTYDNAGRLLTKTFPATPGESFTLTWDQTAGGNKGMGRLTRIDGQGGDVLRTYDNLGQIVRERKILNGIVYDVHYSHDADGNVTEMVYPSGRIVTCARDSVGRISGVTTKANAASPSVTLASSILYREFGPLRSLTYGNGLIFSRSYTQDYRLNVLRVREPVSGANTLRRIHAYGDGLNLTGITETAVAGRNESYSYTPTNRLATAAGIWGSLTWSYDGVGNRTQEILNDGSAVITSDYGYPAGSNRLQDVTQGSATVRGFTHDAAGNITHDDRAGTVYRYIYNDRGRLMQLRVDNIVRANYRYDFFERINWRQTQNMTPTGATHYIQDLQGQLIVEATDTGTMLREYVWLDDMPLAVFADLDTASPQLYYVHPDHLNRPLRMTDGSQAVVWDATYSPFGEVHSITGSATLNLRFPGQYFVIENGLAYNWHRHYDPSLGRYTQPDPIADNRLTAPQRDAMYPASTSGVPLPFQDGPSVYAYALSSPAVYTDPTGEDVTICYYPSRTGGHVGFGVSGESGTHGFYPKDWYRIFNDPGEIRPDEQSGGQCKVIRTPPDKDQCMKQCRSRRDADPGLYNLFTRQCTSFVRECLLACGIDPGRYAGPFPEFFFKQ